MAAKEVIVSENIQLIATSTRRLGRNKSVIRLGKPL